MPNKDDYLTRDISFPNQKIVNINEKIHSHKLNIKSNEQKILKQQKNVMK